MWSGLARVPLVEYPRCGECSPATLAHHGEGQHPAVLHALAVGALEGQPAAQLQVIVHHQLLVHHHRPPGLVRRVPLQHVARANHHARGLEGGREVGGWRWKERENRCRREGGREYRREGYGSVSVCVTLLAFPFVFIVSVWVSGFSPVCV